MFRPAREAMTKVHTETSYGTVITTRQRAWGGFPFLEEARWRLAMSGKIFYASKWSHQHPHVHRTSYAFQFRSSVPKWFCSSASICDKFTFGRVWQEPFSQSMEFFTWAYGLNVSRKLQTRLHHDNTEIPWFVWLLKVPNVTIRIMSLRMLCASKSLTNIVDTPAHCSNWNPSSISGMDNAISDSVLARSTEGHIWLKIVEMIPRVYVNTSARHGARPGPNFNAITVMTGYNDYLNHNGQWEVQ